MDKTEEMLVDGYLFSSSADAEIAREESKKIIYIENRLNYDDEASILVLYKKMLSNRVFVTPIGYAFLKKLQSYLSTSPEISADEILPIPLYTTYSAGLKSDAKEDEVPKAWIKPKEGPDFKGKLGISRWINVLLALLVIIMFVITLNADNPNIINYENALINKYASWEQELSQRESIVREKERELSINQDKE